jgi:hypothetical protein
LEKGSERGEVGGLERERRDGGALKGLDGAGALFGELSGCGGMLPGRDAAFDCGGMLEGCGGMLEGCGGMLEA